MAWSSMGPSIVAWRALCPGQPLGQEIAERADDLARNYDERDAEELAALMGAAVGDDEAMAALFAEFDAGELLDLLREISTQRATDEALAVAAARRATRSSLRPGRGAFRPATPRVSSAQPPSGSRSTA